jgi:hypothetical protein
MRSVARLFQRQTADAIRGEGAEREPHTFARGRGVSVVERRTPADSASL